MVLEILVILPLNFLRSNPYLYQQHFCFLLLICVTPLFCPSGALRFCDELLVRPCHCHARTLALLLCLYFPSNYPATPCPSRAVPLPCLQVRSTDGPRLRAGNKSDVWSVTRRVRALSSLLCSVAVIVMAATDACCPMATLLTKQ